MTISIAAIVSIATGVAAAAVTIATVVVSNQFFAKLVSQHPELSDQVRRPSVLTQYGPIYPSKQTYLKDRRFKELTDPQLRQMGQTALILLKAYAVAFVLFLICILWWATARQLA